VLPLIAYVGFIGFIYTNNQTSLSLIYFSVSFLIFSLLFINVRAYYQDKFKLEQQTHIVYDLIKIFLFFTIIDSLLNLSSQYDFNFFVVAGLVFTTSSLLTLLILLRHKHLGYFNLVLVLLSGLAIGYLTSALQALLDTKTLIASFYSTLIFYIFNAILHHDLERTLRFNVVLEYSLVAAICFFILLLLP
jgi:hypothetical protein